MRGESGQNCRTGEVIELELSTMLCIEECLDERSLVAAVRGCSSMVEQQPSKLMTTVRFRSPAPVSSMTCVILALHSDKGAVAHSDKCPPSVLVERRFLAPAATCFIVRLA